MGLSSSEDARQEAVDGSTSSGLLKLLTSTSGV